MGRHGKESYGIHNEGGLKRPTAANAWQKAKDIGKALSDGVTVAFLPIPA